MRYALFASAVLTLSLPLNSYAKLPSVAVDIAPIHSLVSQVMEGVGQPNLLIPSGASPHQYILRPSEAKALADAEVVFWVGEGLTPWLEKSLDNLAESAQKIELLEVSGITTYPFREGATFESHDEGEEEGAVEGHDEAHAFEWAGAFKLDAGEYVWSFAKVDGDYAAPAIKLVFLASNLDGEAAIENGEETAEILMQSQAIEKVHGDKLTANGSNVYQLAFDSEKNVSEFRVVIKKEGAYTFFTEHAPSEFEVSEHFFQTTDQRDIEPTAQEPDADHHHHHNGVDPHAWLDPENAKIWINEINQVLSKHDPQNAKVYDSNARQAIAKLNGLIATTRKKISSIDGLNFIVFHDAYQYFEKRFGISAAGSISLGDAQDPSPARIKEIRDTVKKLGVTCVFTEPQYNPGLVENVFEGTTVSIIGVMDPLGASLTVGDSHYKHLIEGMVSSLSQCD